MFNPFSFLVDVSWNFLHNSPYGEEYLSIIFIIFIIVLSVIYYRYVNSEQSKFIFKIILIFFSISGQIYLVLDGYSPSTEIAMASAPDLPTTGPLGIGREEFPFLIAVIFFATLFSMLEIFSLIDEKKEKSG